MKSMADSVAFPPQPNKPLDADFEGVALEIVNEMARTVRASTAIGSEDLRQRSNDSENVMKMPAFHQPQALSIRNRRTYHFRCRS